MDKKTTAKFKAFDRRKREVVLGSIVVVAALIILLIIQLAQPARSVTAYCKVYGQEKARLTAMSNDNDPYPSGVFNVSVNDAGQIATSFGRLDRVAPSEIEPDVKNLQKLYQDIHDSPSHAINDSLNGGSIDDNLKAWTTNHCNSQT
ncbi:MAG TPA: hypothetical protein VLG09_03635 [Candidatus Saccharimonadales bacterium]|nr:hypothetical protein [Candidatus Saccharimonadales bacterium]